jgi:hypothetical protein
MTWKDMLAAQEDARFAELVEKKGREAPHSKGFLMTWKDMLAAQGDARFAELLRVVTRPSGLSPGQLAHVQPMQYPALAAQEDARFAELVENVGVTVRYFNERVEAARGAGGWDWSVEKVLHVIQGTAAPMLPSLNP